MSSSMNDDAVSHRGMLRNMLKQGFTPRQDLSDFELQAVTGRIHLRLQTLHDDTFCFGALFVDTPLGLPTGLRHRHRMGGGRRDVTVPRIEVVTQGHHRLHRRPTRHG